ncbi:GNAT family N-acetyltransferase [Cellvibrio japonicus]|nr:GNAT family N-acetyltransferase [Cellvibrio japonicus]QEI12883.1 GNAT family N-acetyltransferase [Cellvibrio japonicus]QEI16457.1 GNAT family N-acetyltransferase [Cellvibrio japonicus]QEI20035.1 GNAT family N-acetyltransferase [Cellvibrio japonicus]
MAVEILKTDWQTHSAELTRVRTLVFMEEQQVSAEDEWDGLDNSATHFLVTDNQQTIGCARLLQEHHNGQTLFHIGRVAILKPRRGQGIGHQLMQVVINHCRQLSPTTPIYLHAQCERQHFYEVLGFEVEGDIFIDAGIPHISMRYKTQ